MNMKEMWNKRYSSQDYAYGKEPNEFFLQTLEKYQPRGKILLPCEGEGRNAVVAAKKGLSVFAFDISDEGKKKAIALAKHEGVEINYEVGNFVDVNLENHEFDVAALIFAHFPSELLHTCHRKISRALKPGGLVIIEAFHIEHSVFQKSNPNVGGPKDKSMLFMEETIERDFPDFTTVTLDVREINLSEGKFHNGTSKVLRYVGIKQ